MAKHETVEAARNRINEILVIKPEVITREVELGSTLSFAGLGRDLTLAREFLSTISDEVLGSLGDAYVRDFGESCANLLQTMQRVREYTVAVGNPQNAHDQIQNEFEQRVSHLISNFRPIFLESVLQRADPAHISTAIDSAISASLAPYMPKLDAIGNLRSELHQQKTLAAETIEKLQAAAASSGVAKYRGIFDTEATAHDKQAKPWLIATVGVVIATVAVAAGLSVIGLVPEWLGIAPVSALQLSLTKIILVGLGISAAIWCGSNYRSLRHLVVVNKHRANALATYEIFAAATSDPQERGLILTQSAQAIFGHVPTGYLGKDGGGHSDGSPQILQIARDAGRAIGHEKP